MNNHVSSLYALVHGLLNLGMDDSPIYSDHFARLNREVYRQALRLYSAPEGNTPREEARLYPSIPAALNVTLYDNGCKQQHTQHLLDRCRNVLDRLPASFLEVRLFTCYYGGVYEEELAKEVHSIIDTWDISSLTSKQTETIDELGNLGENQYPFEAIDQFCLTFTIMNFISIVLIFLISAAIAHVLIPRILLIPLRKKLLDIPDDCKVYKRAIPRLGGVLPFPTTLFAFYLVYIFHLLGGDSVPALYVSYLLLELLLFACGMTLLCLTGIVNDLVGIRYRQKFIIQVFCARLFPLSELWVNDLYGLFGIHEFSVYVGIPFTILAIVLITNATNLIDGIDSLTSDLSSVALLIFTFPLIGKGLWSYTMLTTSTLGVLVPLFYYNVFGSVERAHKIFMGDTGNLTLGYTLSFLAIKYSQHSTDTMPYTEGAFITAFSTVITPASDVVRIVLVCIHEGYNPFESDKNHIHHRLLAIGLSPRKTMLNLLSMPRSFSAANILLVPYVSNTVLLVTGIVIQIRLNL